MLGVHAPELPIGRFLKSKSLGGNRVIFAVICERHRVPQGRLQSRVP